MLVNSENPDLMTHYAAPDLGLCYYFLKSKQLYVCDLLSAPSSISLLSLCECEVSKSHELSHIHLKGPTILCIPFPNSALNDFRDPSSHRRKTLAYALFKYITISFTLTCYYSGIFLPLWHTETADKMIYPFLPRKCLLLILSTAYIQMHSRLMLSQKQT